MCSGVSSTVRRCVEKGTQTEFAVKIIDLTQEKDNEDLTEQLRDSTKQEMQVLRIGSEHPNISKDRVMICILQWLSFLAFQLICRVEFIVHFTSLIVKVVTIVKKSIASYVLTIKAFLFSNQLGSHATWKVLESHGTFFFKFPDHGRSWTIRLVFQSPGN